jgi:4-amino-4-deoxy-L-arabinose transferase-like glycosyltransferase
MRDRKVSTLLILLLFAVLLSVRLIHLTADPPYNLSTSGGPWGDPGGYSQNARAKVLYGTWEIDGYNMMYSSYPPHLLTYAVFKVFGVGLAQQNIVPVLFSTGALAVFFLLLRLAYGLTPALLGTLLLGINYLFLMFSRIADRVMPPLFFLLLGIFFLAKGKKKTIWNLAAGISFILALISKSVVFYALGAILLGYFLHLLFHEDFKTIVRSLALLLAGALIILIPWYFFLFTPSREFTAAFAELNVKYLIPPLNGELLLRYFWIRPPILFKAMPVLAASAALFSLSILHRMIRRPRMVTLMEWIFGLWFSVGYIYYAFIQQRVTRHFIPQIVPLVFLTAALIHRLLKQRNNKLPQGEESDHSQGGKTTALFGLLSFFWMLFPVSLGIKLAAERFPRLFPSNLSQNLILFGIAALLTGLLILFVRRWAIRPPVFSAGIKKAAVGLIVIGVVIFQAFPYFNWALDPPCQIRQISRDYGNAYDQAVFAGLWAPIVSLENDHRAHEYFRGYVNSSSDFFKRFGITHVFTTTAFRENLIFAEDFPAEMSGAKLLARYHIWTTEVLLYDINPADMNPEGLFEAELYTAPGTMPRYDPEASGDFALHNLGKVGVIAEIPVSESLVAGTHQMEVRLRASGRKNPQTPVLRIEALSPSSRRVLVRKELTASEIQGNTYGDYVFTFVTKRIRDLRLRLTVLEKGNVWIDCLKNIPQSVDFP